MPANDPPAGPLCGPPGYPSWSTWLQRLQAVALPSADDGMEDRSSGVCRSS